MFSCLNHIPISTACRRLSSDGRDPADVPGIPMFRGVACMGRRPVDVDGTPTSKTKREGMENSNYTTTIEIKSSQLSNYLFFANRLRHR